MNICRELISARGKYTKLSSLSFVAIKIKNHKPGWGQQLATKQYITTANSLLSSSVLDFTQCKYWITWYFVVKATPQKLETRNNDRFCTVPAPMTRSIISQQAHNEIPQSTYFGVSITIYKLICLYLFFLTLERRSNRDLPPLKSFSTTIEAVIVATSSFECAQFSVVYAKKLEKQRNRQLQRQIEWNNYNLHSMMKV